MSKREIRALLRKYEVMLELRAHVGKSAPKRELRALASRFPGALRELDALPPQTLHARVRTLRRLSPRAAVPLWAHLAIRFHFHLRAILLIRRMPKHSVLEALLVEARKRSIVRGLRTWWPSRRQIQSPPEGRLVSLAYTRLREEFGLTKPEVDELLFEKASRGA